MFREPRDLNNALLNYFFVNGYQQSFEELAALVSGPESLKLPANNTEKLEAGEGNVRVSFHERTSFEEIRPASGTQLPDSAHQGRGNGRRDSEALRDFEPLLPPFRRSRLSESGLPRKQSLIRIKMAISKENEEVRKILACRSSAFTRAQVTRSLGRHRRLCRGTAPLNRL